MGKELMGSFRKTGPALYSQTSYINKHTLCDVEQARLWKRYVAEIWKMA
jgi:hypothetical protein